MKSIEELQLIAWHHMINDPFLQVYVRQEDGRFKHSYVNPKLAYKRSLIAIANGMENVKLEIGKSLIPAFNDISETFDRLTRWFDQLSLEDRLTDGDPVE